MQIRDVGAKPDQDPSAGIFYLCGNLLLFNSLWSKNNTDLAFAYTEKRAPVSEPGDTDCTPLTAYTLLTDSSSKQIFMQTHSANSQSI